jgi:hypothetical protein
LKPITRLKIYVNAIGNAAFWQITAVQFSSIVGFGRNLKLLYNNALQSVLRKTRKTQQQTKKKES